MDRRIWIIIGILAIVALGFFLVTNMTGGVITGMSVGEVTENEYFNVNGASDEGELNEEVNLVDTQNSGRSG